jgi:hypothetical protein
MATPVTRLLAVLVEEQTRQRETLAQILRLLEHGRGARDAADVALLVAVAEAIGDRTFTSAQVVAHARTDPALRDAIDDADITNPQELGCVFRRLEGITVTGLRLERVGDQREGVQWRVQVCEA